MPLRLYTLIALLGSIVAGAAAALSPSIPFQGQLKTPAGQPITNPAIVISTVLWDAPTGGNPLYAENQTIAVKDGLFSMNIGDGNPSLFATLPRNVPYYIGLSVGGDPEMTPRIAMGAVPFAVYALSVPYSGVTGAPAVPTTLPPSGPAGGDLNGTYPQPLLAIDSRLMAKVSGGAVTVSGARVGVDTSSPLATLDVNGTMGIHGNNTLEFGAGIAGKETNAGKIGYGTFTSNALDIVGAGSTAASRYIKFHNEGGAGFSGWVGIGTDSPQSPLHLRGDAGLLSLEGSDHCYIQFYPRGFDNGRKAYIGFPGAGSHDLAIANEDTGVVEVVGTFVNNSDARLKTRVQPLDGALNAVLGLRGVTYNWRTDRADLHATPQRQIGFLAQDVEKVLPDLVYTDTNGVKSVAYLNLLPVVVEAMKAQQQEIAAKDAEIASLRAEMDSRLAKLEARVGR